MNPALMVALGTAGVEPFHCMFGGSHDDEDETQDVETHPEIQLINTNRRKHFAHVQNIHHDGSFTCERCGQTFRENDGSICQ